ncbi:MAG: cell division protein ZapA [Fibrobacterales bacterium]|nr:cell division protein ZapA [Fibrobacterales bacterium]MBP5189155.1 cell division protein ZapA [Fibrobacterales bacterium]
MVEGEALRKKTISLCGQSLSIRTDLDEATLAELVAFAEERLAALGVGPAVDDPQRVLLPFLVVCGELLESRKKADELRLEREEADKRLKALAELLEKSDIP